jgi:hypothetical protein
MLSLFIFPPANGPTVSTLRLVSILKRFAMHHNLLIIDAESRSAGQSRHLALVHKRPFKTYETNSRDIALKAVSKIVASV